MSLPVLQKCLRFVRCPGIHAQIYRFVKNAISTHTNMHGQGFEGFQPWYFLKGVYFWPKMTFLTKNRKQIDLDTTYSIKQIKDWFMKYYLLWKPNLRVSYYFLWKSGKIGEKCLFCLFQFSENIFFDVYFDFNEIMFIW